MMQLESLGDLVEKKWKATGGRIDQFTKVATEVLTDLDGIPSLRELEKFVLEWLLRTTTLPRQISLYNSFGQPSITLFNNGRFVVDLYFWVDFDTSIHSHGFRGAFRVLHGQSLHETFHTPVINTIAEDVRTVDMSRVDREILSVDDIREIAPGLDLTHRVVHLKNPTVTLCVRTVNEESLRQWTYLSTGLSIRKEEVSADFTKKVLYFQFLFGRDQDEADQFLKASLDAHSLSEHIHLYEEVASGVLSLRPEVSQHLVEEIVDRHQNSDWWKLYETAHLARMNELVFEHCQDPRERLVGHFINSKLSYREAILKMSLDEAAAIAQGLLVANDPANPIQVNLVNQFLT